MTFHSLEFILLFVPLLALYWCCDRWKQNLLLLVASYVFYGFFHPWFVALMVGSTTVDYLSALAIERWPTRKRLFLFASVSSNLSVLGVFKYFNFFVQSFQDGLALLGLPAPSTAAIHIFLPAGISFYTFQALSYVIDVYRGELAPRRNYVDFALYLAFFPQLVAGPIERARDMFPQFESNRRVTFVDVQEGLFLVVWGYFKKLVIADNVALTCNKIFALRSVDFPLLWVGVFAFAIQIYADFSAYSDIARGTARWFGFRLSENFRHPYLARSPADFWRRWHISLSNWIRDYVYIPLGGSRVGPGRQVFNVFVTFAIFGLWHGASWNFVLWGAYHGFLVLIFRGAALVTPSRIRSSSGLLWLRIPLMFALTCFGWLIFRETDPHFLARFLTLPPTIVSPEQWVAARYLFVLTCLYSLPLWLHAAYSHWESRYRAPEPTVWALKTALCSLMVTLLLLLSSEVTSDFIYFQF